MQRHLIDYIRRPENLDTQAAAQLEGMIKDHPYFHSARILYLQALYKQHSPKFDEELRHSSVMIPERQAIFHLIEEQNYTKVEERKKYATEDYEEDRSQLTSNLIANFLEKQASPEPTGRRNHRIDATQDYIGYLLQNEEKQEEEKEEESLQLNGGGVVEDFLNQEPQRIVLKDTEPEQKEMPKEDENDGENEILTEVMAGIYIKQGKFENAIKIIRQLSLKYPKKNRYFADQIRFLEKIIINNKHK